MVGTNDEAGQLRGWADLATTQEHQFTQLGSWGAAGWCNKHLRLIGKEGSLVSLGRQLALKSADLRRKGSQWGQNSLSEESTLTAKLTSLFKNKLKVSLLY